MLADLLILASGFSIVIRLIYAVIGRNADRGLPAQFPDRLPAGKRDALVSDGIPRPLANEGSVDALDRQRLVIFTIGDLPVLAVLSDRFLLLLRQAQSSRHRIHLTHVPFSFLNAL